MQTVNYAERLQLIREIAERKNKLAKIKQKTQNVHKLINVTERKSVFEDGENINHYTDASKYAKEYYGDTLHYTTRFDNDWD